MRKAVKFQEWLCTVKFGRYQNGRIAIQLMNAEPVMDYGYLYPPNSMPIAHATINIPDFENIEDDEVIIKDYTENEGMLDSLLRAGIVEKPKKYAKSGWINAPVCKLLVKPE